MTAPKQFVQAFIEMRADDPEATSALAAAQRHLEAGRSLAGLRRMRVFELSGSLPPRATLEELLHRSTQFYNPSKERCAVRADSTDPAPGAAGELYVIVFERGGERRAAAERWWRHETGARIEVREGGAWAMTFAPRVDAPAAAGALTATRDRKTGSIHFYEHEEWRPASATGAPPLPWIATKPITRGPRARKGKASS